MLSVSFLPPLLSYLNGIKLNALTIVLVSDVIRCVIINVLKLCAVLYVVVASVSCAVTVCSWATYPVIRLCASAVVAVISVVCEC